MNNLSPFTVYDASAGSGKTFAITRQYLSLLFMANRPDAYRNILAMTFTNKAVEEMKTRIIDGLAAFSEEKTPKKYGDLLKLICSDTGLTEKQVKEKSKNILKNILHDYSSFVISTIDAFTNRVLRTFAKDLGLQVNYEVEIDSGRILSEAVSRVIAQAGDDEELTKTLVDFAISKADDDKSWDIEHDLNEVAKLLVNENNRLPLAVLGKKTLEDFRVFSEKLDDKIENLKKTLAEKTACFFQLLKDNELDESCFSGKYVPKYFLNFRQKRGYLKATYGSQWQENIADEVLYTKAFPKKFPEKAAIIDRLQPEIAALFLESKETVFQLLFLEKIRNNLTQLSLMGHIRQEVEEIKKEENILLIADFNEKIAQSIQGQPVPFIYERLGERYRDYFIDEFQDTSVLQWENMKPLVSNRLSGEDEKQRTGSLTIVGDAKQAIYRWRGGKAEQFMDLCAGVSPFPGIEIGLESLPSNYRSEKEIVEFNNAFFSHSVRYLDFETHRQLFENARQKVEKEYGGYVNISFIEKQKNKEEKNQAYAEKVLETITHLTTNGYSKKDICILVRKNDEGIVLADFLNENNIEIISSETLLVRESPIVKFLNNLLGFSLDWSNDEIKLELLYFLLDRFPGANPHSFLSEGLSKKGKHFFEFLKDFGIQFDLEHFHSLPLYDAVEYAVREFGLISDNNAYLQGYLDFLFEYSRQKTRGLGGGIPGFLAYWKLHEDKLSIVSPEGKEAVQIMTIHKSKGLEFPIVIYPFADNAIDETKNSESVWVPLEEKYDFPYAYFSASRKMLDFGENAAAVFHELVRSKELDAMNVLYVALTRAEKQLYIISQAETPGKNGPHKYSHFFIEFLKSKEKWEEDKMEYAFGDFSPNRDIRVEIDKVRDEKFISTDPASHGLNISTKSGSLWLSTQEEAIGKGTVLHEIMAQILEKDDLEKALKQAYSGGLISEYEVSEMREKLLEVVNHPQLRSYFAPGNQRYIEREILFQNRILRPDRINLDGNMASIIDYKTGLPAATHSTQISNYAQAVSGMGYKIKEILLVYVNEKVELKRVG